MQTKQSFSRGKEKSENNDKHKVGMDSITESLSSLFLFVGGT